MLSNEFGDEGLEKLAHSGRQVKKYKNLLINLAEEDSVTVAGGLELKLDILTSWTHHPVLRTVRKWRHGGHRFYIQGRNADCRYTLIHVVVNKRAEEDRAEEAEFQSKILRALASATTHLLK